MLRTGALAWVRFPGAELETQFPTQLEASVSSTHNLEIWTMNVKPIVRRRSEYGYLATVNASKLAPHPMTLADLTDRQLDRCYRRLYDRLNRDNGTPGASWDWPTMYVTRPALALALKAIATEYRSRHPE
jgi:hypothetical protein